MSLVHNERTKLSATYLNVVAIAVMAVGGVGPIVSVLNGGAAPALGIAAISVICLTGSIALHFLARRLLGSLVS
ncbi:amino acid transporter [Ancylobacter sp. SL191]|uniref:amino acid transporter n=1 Tax=Ancylobacter sp. SL191 TaxID=2995166 RepID=UPI0022711CD4|nr:amino acid transporter [Ancylobacter sp. SL191]WAC28105.1 amino acid transporter [Ancylobacter sp. SL191]